MTATAFFERLYLVLGLHQFASFVTMPSAPTSPPLALRLFLDFFDEWLVNFFVCTIRQVISPGTLVLTKKMRLFLDLSEKNSRVGGQFF